MRARTKHFKSDFLIESKRNERAGCVRASKVTHSNPNIVRTEHKKFSKSRVIHNKNNFKIKKERARARETTRPRARLKARVLRATGSGFCERRWCALFAFSRASKGTEIESLSSVHF